MQPWLERKIETSLDFQILGYSHSGLPCIYPAAVDFLAASGMTTALRLSEAVLYKVEYIG